MDLYAYGQIDSLSEIVAKNGIYCPRLRGYRLMKDEEPVLDEFWKDEEHIAEIVTGLCCSIPFWTVNSHLSEYSCRTNRKRNYYLNREAESNIVKWDRIKGKKRKILKTAIHNQNVRYKRQYDMWNKYAGQDGILYIHARIGGDNWISYYQEVVNQPWFIEKVDDAFDSTYCDIYARIKTTDIA